MPELWEFNGVFVTRGTRVRGRESGIAADAAYLPQSLEKKRHG